MDFSQKVLKLIKRIPKGKVATYGEVAKALKKPRAARAVGNALNANPHPITVPCHRIVNSDGFIGGYARGSRKKKRLLESEGIKIFGNKIDLQKYGFELK